MRDGKLLAIDTPSNLKKEIVHGDVWEISAEPLERGLTLLSGLRKVLRVSLAGDHLRTITEQGLEPLELRQGLEAEGLKVSAIVPGDPSLEDVFLSIAR
jgi:ABC-type multidrug transport system ATPase subunit